MRTLLGNPPNAPGGVSSGYGFYCSFYSAVWVLMDLIRKGGSFFRGVILPGGPFFQRCRTPMNVLRNALGSPFTQSMLRDIPDGRAQLITRYIAGNAPAP